MTLTANVQVKVGTGSIGASLEVGRGEVVVLLGPNGAGKTTLLRAIAGLLGPVGTVVLDDRVLDGDRFVEVEDRNLGVVFQELLLFPHMTVDENIAFAALSSGASRQDARTRTDRFIERLELQGLRSKKPGQLSGGEKQRVALARALGTEPAALLLDEPFAALDAASRVAVRRLLVDHVRTFDGPTILVTHDPLEALVLADRIIVLEEGRVVQEGMPEDLRSQPRSPYVASVVGINLFAGTSSSARIAIDGMKLVAAEAPEGQVLVAIHPRAVAMHRDRPEGTPRNVWRGHVRSVDDEGDRLRVRVGGDLDIVSEITPSAKAELQIAEGSEVWLSVKATEIVVYPA